MSTPQKTHSDLSGVEYLDGIHLVDSVLWLDAPRRSDLCFISHHHVPSAGQRGKLLMSEPTARLARRADRGRQVLVSPFFRRFALGELDLELVPAGHIFGSAQLRVTRGGQSLVYTGHFNLQAGRVAETATILRCDTLVLAAHYGLPHMRFPERSAVERDLMAWIEEVLAAGDRPILIASPLGTAQELAALLGHAGLPLRAHRAIYETCKTLHGFGVKLPNVRAYRGTPRHGEVALFPNPRATAQSRRVLKTLAAEKASGARLALVSGEEAPGGRLGRLKLDRAFALSSLSDHAGLMRYALESRAKHIAVVGRHASAFAAALREKGLSAWPLQAPKQLDLLAPRTSN